MATNYQDPPALQPRVESIYDPGDGFYRVAVAMPPDLKTKFPDEPWLVKIDSIGLPSRESSKYPNYVLVDFNIVQPSRTFKDYTILWIFEKLNGRDWVTNTQARNDLIPAKFQSFIIETKTETDVTPDTPLTELTGDVVFSRVEDVENTGKARRTDVSEILDPTVAPLIGELTDTWGVNTTSEALVVEGTAATFGYGVKNCTVTPLGNGKSVEYIERYPEDVEDDGIIHTLEGREVDEDTGIIIEVTKSLVDRLRAASIADTWTASPDYGTVEIKPLDKWHSLIVTGKIVESSIATHTWYEVMSLNLPNELQQVGVVWDSNSQGNYSAGGVDNLSIIVADKLGWRVEASASVSGAVMGAPYTKFKAGFNGYAKVKVTRTFHIGPPSGEDFEIENFYGGYGSITIFGEQATVVNQTYKAGVGNVGTASGGGSRFNFDKKMAIHNFGPCVIPAGIGALTELGDDSSISDSYIAQGGSTPSNGLYPTAAASISLSGRATVHLPSTVLPTSGSSYVAKVDIRPWRLGYWVKEVYEVFVP